MRTPAIERLVEVYRSHRRPGEDFIAAVRDPIAPRPKPDFTEGIRYMRVVNGVWDSMADRATVKVG